MNLQQKLGTVKERAKSDGVHISGEGLPGHGYYYGENPFADMLIENALFCDMFPGDVDDPENFFGFRRSDYSISRSANNYYI